MHKEPELLGIANGRWWFTDGRSVPVVSGGAEGDPDPEPDPEPDPNAPPKTFTQEQVNRIAAKEKSDGKKAAQAELLSKLGVSTFEEAQAILDKQKAADEATKDEATKAREAADKEKREAATEREAAKRERLTLKIEKALVKAGLDPDEAELVAEMVKITNLEADQDEVSEAVDAFKEKMPKLFAEGETPDPKKPKPKPGDPGGPPRKKGDQPDTKTQARSLLAERHPQSVKQS